MSHPQVKISTFGSESGHWYDINGNCVLEVERAKPGTGYIKTRLNHARKLDLAPGVTTIIKQAHAEQLVNWRIGQAVLAAKTLDQQEGEDDRTYLQRVHDDANTHAREAARIGTEVHGAIESHYRGQAYPEQYNAHVAAVDELLRNYCGDDADWQPEAGVVSPLGYGTKADCVSVRNGWLVDFKGCDGTQAQLDAKRTFESHHMQLAATRDCIDAELRCAIVWVSRDHPGAAAFCEVDDDVLIQNLEMFRHLLGYWQAKNNHYPWRAQ